MTGNVIEKIIIVIIYLAILLLIPLFIDVLFRVTVRKRRAEYVRRLAEDKAREVNKPLIIFYNLSEGMILDIPNGETKPENFTGDISKIADQISDDSCVVMVSETFEYITGLEIFIKRLQTISGNNLYAVNIEKNSPRIFWDYRIVNIMDKPLYLPTSDEIKWQSPDRFQEITHRIYSYIFRILPYSFFARNTVKKV